LKGKDVELSTLTGDIRNDRTITTIENSGKGFNSKTSVVDSAARVEAGNNLTMHAARDSLNVGGAITAGKNADLSAGNDVVISAAREETGSTRQDKRHFWSESQTVQHASEVKVGGDLDVVATNDLTMVAGHVKAGGDVNLSGKDVNLLAAADEESSEYRYKRSGKKIKQEEEHVRQQGTTVEAGGDVNVAALQDVTMVSSKITAGNEAYLVAGNQLNFLANQDSDYSLYDMKKKGSWGAKKTKRDEVTDVKNIGSEIKTGGDLTLESGGDQLYQAAKLDSGGDIAIVSGGAVTFEAIKDLRQESHEKSRGDAFWTSSKGKGNTDETLRQTQMVAEGNIAIKAVEGLKIDVRQVNQQTVSQSIDAMVKADPQLAWLKEAEKRGDVDWRLVKEIHDSYKYSNSGLGPASQIIIAIVMAAVVGPLASSAVGGAVATGVATNATVSTINNRGNLGAVFKDVTSSNAMKGYVISGVTAGLTAGYFNEWTGTYTNPVTNQVIGPNLSTWTGVGQFAASQTLQSGTSMLLSKALGQGGSASDALKNALFNTLAAASFNAVGDYTKGVLNDGMPPKILIHAMVGGLLSEATGGDFKTGALAAGVNEAVVVQLDKLVSGNKTLLSMNSQIVGVLAAAAQRDADAQSIEKGGWVAKNATQYNYAGHQEIDDLEEQARNCKALGNCDEVRERFRKQSVKLDDELAADCAKNPALCTFLYGDLLHDRNSLQERLGKMYFDDSIPSMFKEDLHRYQLQNTAAIGVLIQAQTESALESKGVSPEKAAWVSKLVAATGGFLGGKGKGNGSSGSQTAGAQGAQPSGAQAPTLASSGPKIPPKLEPFTNPPQGPVIPSGWVSRPGRTPGSTIYYPPGTNPSDKGSTHIRLMPPGSTPVPGLQDGYWIYTNKGQAINPATGKPGGRGDTHIPLPPNSVPPPR
ncbi:DUF637 domain-containing protein, partial [Pseudomonas protegens]|uniref:DUF637 domain-containing protein n=1 Tax=Pseudomonas protegens TaxID=380021 RepID=UPI0038188759